jgi:transcriptional regulator with XRE-family HTH domain
VSDLNSKLKKFLDKNYRDSYLDSHVKSSIAYQIQELRGEDSQTDFGIKVGMKQTAISRLESGEGGGVNVNTLLKIASGCKVGLQVKFCDFETVLREDVSPSGLRVETVEQTIERLTPKLPTTTNVKVTTAYLQEKGTWPRATFQTSQTMYISDFETNPLETFMQTRASHLLVHMT